jgi:hypothetical protein
VFSVLFAYFHRDASSGLLAYADNVAVAQTQCHSTMTCPVGQRLYVLLTRWANNGGDNRLADRGGPPLWTAEIEGGEVGHFDWGSG